jgi:single-strand DNA-binding protein
MITVSTVLRLGKDPVQEETKSGKKVTKFSGAVRSRSDKDRSVWFECSAFGNDGETILKYCKKGQQLAVSADLDPRPYLTKEGKSNVSLDLIINSFQFVESAAKTEEAPPVGTVTDDLPF